MQADLLQMEGITKIFPGIKALEDVRFTLRAGEIHALVGENGAGKSTFIKVLAGVHQPDGGEMRLGGETVVMHSPLTAEKHGIACIHQHAASYPDLSVAENIFIGHEFMRMGLIDWKRTYAEAQKLLDAIGADISPTATVGQLSVAQQQLVEIAKALSQRAKILIMDEPTAALSKRESEDLYAISRRLRDQGTAIILISHRFEDIFGLADRATVLRDGRYIGTWDIAALDEGKLVQHMVGRDITQFYPKKKIAPGKALLRVENLCKMGCFRDVSLRVCAGEIVGLTGLVGAGRTEVVEALFGATKLDSGDIYIEGEKVTIASPHEAMARGLGLLPEDRQREGLLMTWSINHNITLPTLGRCQNGMILSGKKEHDISEILLELLRIKAASVEATADSLSGGNQQKVVVAKILAINPRIVILDEPTKGVDVGSKAAIYEIMSDLAEKGIGILMISSEMPEVIHMSDRVYVMREGRIAAEFPAEGLSQTQILEAAMPLAKEA